MRKEGKQELQHMIPWTRMAVGFHTLDCRCILTISKAVIWTLRHDRHWCKNLPGLINNPFFPLQCKCSKVAPRNTMIDAKALVPNLTFLCLCSPGRYSWRICLIPKSECLSIACFAVYINTSWLLIRETERDWDKDLDEDVKSECEEKYGHVEFIKVEKESQVGGSMPSEYTILIHNRARSTSSLIPSSPPRTPSKVWMVDGSVANKFLPPSSQTP